MYCSPARQSRWRVVVAGGVRNERIPTAGHVAGAAAVVHQRLKTEGCVPSSAVPQERLVTDARVARGVLIVVTSVLANGDILRAGGVVAERADADRCILKSSRADNHCAVAYGRISVTAGIANEGAFTHRRVERAGGVAFQRLIPNGCVIAPTGVAIKSKRTRRCVEAGGIIDAALRIHRRCY